MKYLRWNFNSLPSKVFLLLSQNLSIKSCKYYRVKLGIRIRSIALLNSLMGKLIYSCQMYYWRKIHRKPMQQSSLFILYIHRYVNKKSFLMLNSHHAAHPFYLLLGLSLSLTLSLFFSLLLARSSLKLMEHRKCFILIVFRYNKSKFG